MRQRYDTSSRGGASGQRPAAARQAGYEWSVKSLAEVSPALASLPGNQRVTAGIELLASAGITGRNSLGKLVVDDPTDPDEVEAVLAAGDPATPPT
ncbi:MAG TPA: hypothetical protein VMM13_09890 [Euzebya sp.]|nr:hypothetical protein [Euzebya sp.]